MKLVGNLKLKKVVRPILFAFLILTLIFGYFASKTRFDYDFEKFFPSNDAETDYFFDFRSKFESDNDFLQIAIVREKGIFDLQFLKKIDKLTKSIEKVDLVEGVVSITNTEEFFLFANGFTSSRPYIHLDTVDLVQDSINIYKNKELINTAVAKDGKSVCIFIKHKEYISKAKSDKLAADIHELLDKYNFDRVIIAGRTVGQSFYLDKMTFELFFYMGISGILIVLFLFIAFRSIWGIVIPLLIIVCTLIWIFGGMGILNQPVNILLTTLPSVMFVVAMSDVIHIVSRYLDAKRANNDTEKSVFITIREVGFSTFLTSVTTAIGFFSLYFVNMEPIRIYGVVLGFGVLIAYVLAIFILPVLFYYFPGPKYIEKQKEGHFWQKSLHQWFIAIFRKRLVVLLSSVIVIVVGLIGVFQIEGNNYLMDDMREDEPLKQDFNYIDAHYGGIRPFEMAVILKDTSKSFWDLEVLSEIAKVEEFVEQEYGAEVKQSLVQTIKVMNRSSHAGLPQYYELPEKNSKLRSFKRKLRFIDEGKFYKLLVDSTETTTRISGGIGDIGNIEATKRNDQLFAFLDKMESKTWLEFKLTGTSHLMDKNMNYLAMSLVKGLLLSVLIVALIMGIIYRSFSMLIISIIPNLIPLIVVGGIMGYFGITLKTSTAIVFTIAFGIAVDDTIHFLGKFKTELSKGKTKIYALKRSYLTTGKAMILTSLILCSGFMLLIFSSFMGTFYMGLLLSLTLIFALILDLTLLPVLLLLFYRPKQTSKKI